MILLMMTMFFFVIMYYTPLKVLQTMLTNGMIEYLSLASGWFIR